MLSKQRHQEQKGYTTKNYLDFATTTTSQGGTSSKAIWGLHYKPNVCCSVVLLPPTLAEYLKEEDAWDEREVLMQDFTGGGHFQVREIFASRKDFIRQNWLERQVELSSFFYENVFTLYENSDATIRN